MRIGSRLAIGFDKHGIPSLGIWYSIRTIWIDFFGFYINLYVGVR